MYSNVFTEKFSSDKYKIAIVCARFNQKVTEGLLKGAVKTWLQCHSKFSRTSEDEMEKEIQKQIEQEERIVDIFRVPGSVEIPILAQKCAKTKKYDAIITLGAVVRGETAHFDYVCQMVSQGVLKVALDCNLPVIFGVITTNNQLEAENRSLDNYQNKGTEAALAALETLKTIEKLEIDNFS